MDAFNDKEKMKSMAKKYLENEAVRTWGSFASVVIVVFWMFSSGDFSFLLTCSSLVSVFSFLMVAMKIESGKTVKGVSLKMMECYILVFFFRLCAIIPFEGYLPFDKSGDWLYQVCEAFGLCLSGSVVFCCRVQYANTYDQSTDTINHIWLIGPAAAIALIFHPHLNNFLLSDIAWAFALYLESVCVLPQLFMFMKEGKAQAHTSHFLAAQALSRFMSFIFWASSFSELSDPHHYIKKFVGNWVVGIQLLQLVIMADFIYHYVRCLQKGIPVSELLCSSNV
eukprot:gnl/TRDRNA2_/TRDRNA2_191112_c0_seq1.p1 gnl/TRDRNA2_/TRDRNA2_191112_c0~~gnl/TRDRNA2_/TRDRNA2_191112_c0_seq1.p1  ORF type:complete len:281 (+),score=55.85 gnl/TRDRNA2_/TRDRNA2_191112_c0_seq1:110-952(+)